MGILFPQTEWDRVYTPLCLWRRGVILLFGGEIMELTKKNANVKDQKNDNSAKLDEAKKKIEKKLREVK